MASISIEDGGGFFSDQILEFERDLSPVDVNVTREPPAEVQYHFGSDLHTLIITLEPHTVQQIYEYAIALIGVYKAADIGGEFFKAAVSGAGNKLGETAAAFVTGEKVLAALRTLWSNVIGLAMSAKGKKYHPLGLFFQMDSYLGDEELKIVTRAAGDGEVSDRDRALSFHILVFKVLPIVMEFRREANRARVRPEGIRCRIEFDADADAPGGGSRWQWSVALGHNLYFTVDADGVFRAEKLTLNEYKDRRKLSRLLDGHELKIADIRGIVEEYVRAVGRT